MIHPCLDSLPKGMKKQLDGMDFDQQRQFVRDNIGSSEQDIRKALMTAKAQSRILGFLNNTPLEQTKDALLNLFAGKGQVRTGLGSLYGRVKSIENQFHAMFREAMEHHRPGILGIRRDAKGERNMLREIFGQNTGDDIARGFAQQWKKVAEYAMKRFNQAGGNIKQLLDFNMPMYHDAARVGKVSFDEWLEDVKPLIDTSRLAKVVTGATEMSEQQLSLVMRKIYNKLSSDGIVQFDDLGLSRMAKRQLGDYHQEHRILHFKSGDAWLSYFDKYGSGTPYGAMTAYMEAMSRQIGAMEILGPNTEQTLSALRGFADEMFGKGKVSEPMQHIYDNIMGATYGPRTKLGDAAQNLRFASVMGHLGLALPASLGDAAFVGTNLMMKFGGASAFKAVSQMFARTATLQTKSIRTLAARMGLGAEYSMVAARSAARVSEVYGHGIMARGADATIRASGLNIWTQTGKQLYGIETVANISSHAAKEFGGLPRPIRAFMDSYGIGKKEWDILRRAPMAEYQGVRFLDWSEFKFGSEADALSKMVGGIVEETHLAVPEPNPRIKALMNQGTKTGTLAGEVFRTGGLFKTFPMTALVTNFARASTLTGADRLAFIASLVGGTTMLGVVGVQTAEVLKGNDPFNWDDPQLYGKGFLKGGVTGILGDFLFADPNMYGGWASLIAGPVVGDMNQVVNKFMFGTMQDVLTLEDNMMRTAAREGLTTVQKMAPGRMWYSRLAIDRALDLWLSNLNDPAYYQKQRTIRQRMMREEGRGRWFEPGETLPSRPPSMGFE